MNNQNISGLIISVLICTHNRAELLNDVLSTLIQQDLSFDQFEILIIDNNSTDGTKNVSQKFVNKYPRIRYLFEKNLGLSHARNRGWKEAAGKYVAYTDDDCRIPKNWLSKAKQIIGEKEPAIFGGPYFPFYDSPKTKWFKDSYGSKENGPFARRLCNNEYLSGGNIFIKKTILLNLNGFKTNLGMQGSAIGYAEETELITRLFLQKPKEIVYYDPDLFVEHLVPHRKMSLVWIIKSRFSMGKSNFLMSSNKDNQNRSFLLILPKFIISSSKLLLSTLKGILLRDRKQYPFIQNYIYERTSHVFSELGFYYQKILLKIVKH
ncbi:MAG: glycosyltransferase family 2 protein [Anaerolineaceae bacterium]|nr:glycosyltransferase family 2 protein [Anaerolineaceae bacterium]